MQAVHFVLYVADQDRSTRFYSSILAIEPRLFVPGMTEFELRNGCILGLMPERGIKRLLGDAITDPAECHGVPRAEVYFIVDDAAASHQRALDAGARELSAPAARDWGHVVGYCADPDGHVVAFGQAN